jgi:hypothetical protein
MNPWNSTPADIALTPVHKLISKYQTARGSKTKNEAEQSSHKESGFIARLRQADCLASQKRELMYQTYVTENYPEIGEIAQQAQQLHTLFEKLSGILDSFNAKDELRDSYFDTIRSSQMSWDNLSQENKSKLIAVIRDAVKAVVTLSDNRAVNEQTTKQCKMFQEVMDKTSIADESQSFNDFDLEDLHELLNECANSLELFKLNPVLKSLRIDETSFADSP